MLLSEHGSRHQHRHLLTVHHCLEGGSNGYLCLTVAHIPADQSVHRLGFGHVLFYLLLNLHLVWSLHIGEGSLKLLLPYGIGGKGKAGYNAAGSIEG
ncbi:hypothetical protein ES703_109158 [subsurface metagenome]